MKERRDPSSADPAPERVGRKKRTKKPPLWHRIIFDDAMVALVRLLGHDGLPHRDVPAKAQPLIDKFGRERLQEAAAEITEIVGDGDAAIARLTEEAAKLAIQLIGRPRPADSKETDGKSADPQTPCDSAAKPDQLRGQGNSATTPAEPEPSTSEKPPVPLAGVQEATTEPAPTLADQEIEPSKYEWTNYETACVAALLTGDREFLSECLHLVELCCEQVAHDESECSKNQAATEAQTSLLAGQLQRLVCEYNPLTEDDTVFANLLDAALSNVDWHDLADFFQKRPEEGSRKA